MGWSGPMPNGEGRLVGYAVEATCDKDGCDTEIDRGLAYCCGDMHDGDEHCCGGYFCGEHLVMGSAIPAGQACEACVETFEREYPELVEKAEQEWNEWREKWSTANFTEEED